MIGSQQSSTASYPHVSLPLTTQHPHPVPLDLTRSPTPGSISSYYLGPHSGRDGDDFLPVTDPGDWLEDGLNVLVPHQELPSGTPGGKKADLKLGAFVDGARREKDGMFFLPSVHHDDDTDMFQRFDSSPAISVQV
jgi:hypothetical protein